MNNLWPFCAYGCENGSLFPAENTVIRFGSGSPDSESHANGVTPPKTNSSRPTWPEKRTSMKLAIRPALGSRYGLLRTPIRPPSPLYLTV